MNPKKVQNPTTTDSLRRRCFTVKGRVQGVWFRDSTRREAERLGISGHAINLSNGDVEVLAVGEADAVERLAEWLLHHRYTAKIYPTVP